MADVAPIPRTLETPPRTTGNAEQDLPLLVDWFWRAYQVITESVKYINTGSLSSGDNVSELENDAGYIGNDLYVLDEDRVVFSETIGGQTPSATDDLATKGYVDTTFSTGSHAAVTVTDSTEIDFTLSGQNITASIKPGSISSGRLDTGVTGSLGLADTSIQPQDDARLDSLGIGAAPTATSILHLTGLPTSAAGLVTGDVWNDSGTLKIVL